jgi:hypothetical protein
MDGKSSITDVLIDGVILDDCCQGIRMLSRGTGLLDRVTVRNVTGCYRTFGLSIMPFYRGETFGKYGDFFFENINSVVHNLPPLFNLYTNRKSLRPKSAGTNLIRGTTLISANADTHCAVNGANR